MIVGYARTSTAEQVAGLEAQTAELAAAGCTRIFSEQISSTATRIELQKCMSFVREADVLVVTKPDRLARSVTDLLALEESLRKKGVTLRVLSMGGQALDTGTPTGRLMLTVLGAVAEFERSLMLDRQREGIAKAKAEGKYVGRQPTVQRQADEIRRLRAGGMKPAAIARQLGVARSGVYRVLGETSDSGAV